MPTDQKLEITLTTQQIAELRKMLSKREDEISKVLREQLPPPNKIQIIKEMRESAANQGIDLGLKEAKFLADFIVHGDTLGLSKLIG